MNRTQKLRYDMWVENVQKVAHKYGVDIKTLVQIIEGMEDLKALFESVEAEDFINFYLYKERGED